MASCPNCGNTEPGEVVPNNPYFVRCVSCQLLRRASLAQPVDLQEVLTKHHSNEDSSAARLPDEKAARDAAFLRAQASIGSFQNAQALDVGCGWGGFIIELGKLGMKAVGTEASPSRAEFCRSRGLDVRNGRFNAENMSRLFPDRRFDLISFCGVLNGIDEPCAALDLAKNYLAPNGILFVTDHMASSPYYWGDAALTPRIGPTATVFFTSRTLLDTIRRRGFTIGATMKHPILWPHLMQAWGLPTGPSWLYARILPWLCRMLPADQLAVIAQLPMSGPRDS